MGVSVAHASAKINLALHVTGRRPGGYHNLDSLVVFASPGDVVSVAPAEKDSLEISGPFAAALDPDEPNLVERARDLYRAEFPGALPNGLTIRLDKQLPVASGVGGGSADAASSLKALDLLAGNVAGDRLFELADVLGSDVPACLQGKPLRMQGRGSDITPLPHFPACAVVLINPLELVATASVFGALAVRENPPLPDMGPGWRRFDDLIEWLKPTRNDLRDPAVALLPVIAMLEMSMAGQKGCRFARMSGSGATVFGLFENLVSADAAATELQRQWPRYWVGAKSVAGAGIQ
ncbi:MAG: 4-(cytidine 5'-diphospho)-2-C-methyl-D-erythritol kinase [Hyphomicrobiaceae bacterium]|nr:4-(cytidine 5'-diphospho)-2-C-methyl-D-erythritol kinase [Hyphomicrobiaceae bacterium]